MFQSITFRDQNKVGNKPIDIGALLECMLFYDKTNIIASEGILNQLLNDLGIVNLTELVDEGLLKIIYTESFTGIKTENIGGIEFHDPVVFSSPQHMFQDVIRKKCIEITGKEGKGRRSAVRLEKHIDVIHHDALITQGARASILDQEYVIKAVKLVLKGLLRLESEPNDIDIRTEHTERGIVIKSNIDFVKANLAYRQFVPQEHSSINTAFILGHILDVESDLYFSSNLLSEIATNSLSSVLMGERLSYIVNKNNKSSEAISRFNQIILGDSKALREAINAKKVDIVDVVKILKRSRKFKEWLHEQQPSADLLKEYYRAATAETFIDKLPGKTSRWAIFTGLGLVADAMATGGLGTAIGLSLSALDGFFIDRLVKGWNPSQFIEGDVKPILKRTD